MDDYELRAVTTQAKALAEIAANMAAMTVAVGELIAAVRELNRALAESKKP